MDEVIAGVAVFDRWADLPERVDEAAEELRRAIRLAETRVYLHAEAEGLVIVGPPRFVFEEGFVQVEFKAKR